MARKIMLMLLITAYLAACSTIQTAQQAESVKPTIVATTAMLGAITKDLVGDEASVVVPMPNGQDPHEWEPSARDIETIMRADLVVQNGLGLESGMQKALQQAQQSGVRFFTASDHIVVRRVGTGEGIPSGDPDQAIGAEDPHLWMDPVTMKMVADALAIQIKTDLGIDVSNTAAQLDSQFDGVNQEVSDLVNTVPANNRKLVTGHESMGYFAERYHFKLVGAIIPSLTSQAEVSAADLAMLKQLIQENKVKAIFTELGTPRTVADAISQETGAKVIELTTHSLPDDGSYFTFLRDVAQTIVDGLR